MKPAHLKSRHLALFLAVVLAVCVALAVLHLKTDKNPPEINLASARIVNRQSVLVLNLQGGQGPEPAEVRIYAVQRGLRERLEPLAASQGPSAGSLRLEFNLARSELLRDGDLTIEVKARSPQNAGKLGGLLAPFWTEKNFEIRADLTPPTVAFRSSPRPIVHGGAALLMFKGNEELRGISLEREEQSETVLALSPAHFAALVAFPQDAPLDEYKLELRFSDLAGNTASSVIILEAEGFEFREDPIKLDEAFFHKKYKEFSEYTGKKLPPAELFLYMNRTVRNASYEQLRLLCRGGVKEKLWRGAFLEMPSADRRSEFADRRDYIHNGAIIDRQVHLGLDYASIARDRVPAANNGKVGFTGYLGIHGNAVLIDHGLGLYSLYSHLSEILVKEGQQVTRGEFIGRTGASGMAGGDHLHFEMLVNGVSVNPDFWFDAKWLEKNIDIPLARFKGEAHD